MKLIYYAFSTKEVIFKSKHEKKDKKTGILKNAALKIIWWKINMAEFIGNEKINNKFDISRFIQNDVSTASCSHYQVLS